MAQRVRTDWILFLTIVAMVCFGLVMVYSASSVMAELKYKSSTHFIVRQLGWAVVSFFVLMYFKRHDYRGCAARVGLRARWASCWSCWSRCTLSTRTRIAGSALPHRVVPAVGVRQARADRVPGVLHRAAHAGVDQQPAHDSARRAGRWSCWPSRWWWPISAPRWFWLLPRGSCSSWRDWSGSYCRGRVAWSWSVLARRRDRGQAVPPGARDHTLRSGLQRFSTPSIPAGSSSATCNDRRPRATPAISRGNPGSRWAAAESSASA